MQRLLDFWSRSLTLRTVAINVSLSIIAVLIIGGYMAVSIGSSLFEQRRDEAVAEAQLATLAAEDVFVQDVSGTTTSAEMDTIRETALTAARGVISNISDTYWALFRAEDQRDEPLAMGDIQSRGFDDSLITAELREAVTSGEGTPYYQSVQVVTSGGQNGPGLIVGTTVDVPRSGTYELYFVAALDDAQATLEFVQIVMLVGGVAIVVLIGVVSWLLVRMVVGPVRATTEVSVKLARGELDERVQVHGSDDLATLGKNFNTMADVLQEQIEDLEKLSTIQQRFVSDVSHELRTPLTTIGLAGSVIYEERDTFSPAAKRSAELLNAQVDRFEAMLADLLELSRFDAGAATLDTEPTNLVQLAEGEIDAVRPLADERGSELILTATGGFFEAQVDPRRIRRILQNLLGNAIDHGEGEPIEVIVDSNQNAAGIAVRDRGVGMGPEDASHVFDRFYRADPSRYRRTGGTGLGLAISRDDAALHAGTLDVWSVKGEGSMFRLTLPRDRSQPWIPPIRFPDEGGAA